MLILAACVALVSAQLAVEELPPVLIRMGPVTPRFPNSTQKSYLAYSSGVYTDRFNMAMEPCHSCIPYDLKSFKAETYLPFLNETQNFQLPLTITNRGKDKISLISVTPGNYLEGQYIEANVKEGRDWANIAVNQTIVVPIQYSCPEMMDKSSYWQIFNLVIIFNNMLPIELHFQFLCDPEYHPNRFDWSTLILLTVAGVLILLLARFGKIFSFKIIFRSKASNELNHGTIEDDHIFQGFFLGLKQSLFYIAAIGVAMIFTKIVSTQAEYFTEVGVFTLVALTTYHFFNEVLCLISEKKVKKRILCLRLCDVISIMVTSLLMVIYFVQERPWFVSNLLSLCVMGSLVKIFKITSLKSAIKFYGPCMIVNVLSCIYMALYVRYEWDNVTLKYYNSPLLLQIPMFHYLYKKKCGWTSILNILFDGFFLGYTIRFDTNRKTYVYEIVGTMGMILGFVLWLVIQFLVTFPLPISIFSQVPMIGFCVLMASHRGELKLFWTGQFYDEIVLNPYKGEPISQNSIISVHCYGNEKDNQEMKDLASLIGEQKPMELVQSGRPGEYELHGDLFSGLQAQVPVGQSQINRSQYPTYPAPQQQQQASQVAPQQQQISYPAPQGQQQPYTNQPNQFPANQNPRVLQNPSYQQFQNNNAKPLFPKNY